MHIINYLATLIYSVHVDIGHFFLDLTTYRSIDIQTFPPYLYVGYT